jgi:uncharacterized protein YeaO (DUF488 family)
VALKTKRYCDPVDEDDGYRLLVCRYRPRGVRKEDESWDVWAPELGPSPELHAAFYGRRGAPIGWPAYRKRYLAEMRLQGARIADLARRVRSGESVTLLCSSACVDPSRCHRTLLADLVMRAAVAPRRGERGRRALPELPTKASSGRAAARLSCRRSRST